MRVITREALERYVASSCGKASSSSSANAAVAASINCGPERSERFEAVEAYKVARDAAR